MNLRTSLEAAGLNVKTVTGWGTRGGKWALGKPVAVMEHHTAPPVPFPVTKLYGDLLKANINVKPDGTVWLIAQGACNFSSGAGSSVVLSEARLGQPPTRNARERGLVDDMGGNQYFFNFENDHAGDGGPIPQVQHDAIVTATRVVLDHYGLEPGNVISHAEWTTRKRDPYWNGSLRAIEAIRQQLEDDMSKQDALDALNEFFGKSREVPDPQGMTNPDGSPRTRRYVDAVVDSNWHATAGRLGDKNPAKTIDWLTRPFGDGADPQALAAAIVAALGPGLSAAVAAELKKLTLKAQ